MSKSLQTKRARAYNSQKGLCFYCDTFMWLNDPDEVRQKYQVSRRALSLIQCTAEHLHARSDGGRNSHSNIVAACWYCNVTRHRRRRPLNAVKYREHVQRRIRAHRWHIPKFRKLSLE